MVDSLGQMAEIKRESNLLIYTSCNIVQPCTSHLSGLKLPNQFLKDYRLPRQFLTGGRAFLLLCQSPRGPCGNGSAHRRQIFSLAGRNEPADHRPDCRLAFCPDTESPGKSIGRKLSARSHLCHRQYGYRCPIVD